MRNGGVLPRLNVAGRAEERTRREEGKERGREGRKKEGGKGREAEGERKKRLNFHFIDNY